MTIGSCRLVDVFPFGQLWQYMYSRLDFPITQNSWKSSWLEKKKEERKKEKP